MAEEKPEGTPGEPENTPQPDSQPDGTPPKEAETNWEQRYKDLQTDHTRISQRLADVEQPPAEPPEEPEPDEEDEGEFLDKKAAKQMIDAAVRVERMRSANTYFRKNYAELVKYESAIAGIMRTPKDAARLKGASPEERIDAAVKEFKALTEEQITVAKEQAEKDAKEREEKNRKAAGLGGPSTPPPKGDEEGKSEAQELADRKAQSAKRRGLA